MAKISRDYWVKMRYDLDTDLATISIAANTGLDVFAVVGRLHRFWSWANRHTKKGRACNADVTWLDSYLCCAGFSAALQKVGWLSVTENGFVLPKFGKYNGKDARRKELTADRVRKHREKKCNAVGNAKCNAKDVTKALPEEDKDKDKEEDKSKNTKGGKPPLNPQADLIEIPAVLRDSPAFMESWAEWLAYRKEIRVKTEPRTQRSQLKMLAGLGPVAAIEAIEASIRGGWKGLFEPKKGLANARRVEPTAPGDYRNDF